MAYVENKSGRFVFSVSVPIESEAVQADLNTLARNLGKSVGQLFLECVRERHHENLKLIAGAREQTAS